MTTEGYCEEHQADATKDRRSSSARGYGRRWRQEREKYLAAHPFCVECERQGKRTLATDVDHIIPHKGDAKLFWDRKNWQGLCHTCHSIKTAAEDGGFGNRRRG